MGFPIRTQSGTNRPVQSQKIRSSKFHSYVEEELYYLCSKNQGADQLCSYFTADLRLCFCIGENLVFSKCGSYDENNYIMLYTTINRPRTDFIILFNNSIVFNV